MAFLIRTGFALMAAATAAIVGSSAPLQARLPQAEDRIKAAFLYNFTKFVEWPPAALAPDRPFHVCLTAGPTVTGEIETMLRGESVRNLPVLLTAHAPGNPAAACHVFYFGTEESERAAKTIAALKNGPVLTVGEGTAFVERGGMIAFVLEDNRVKFDINKTAIDRVGLVVSSKLLRVARHVRTEPTH
jgi:hypothetical protein